MTAHANEKAQFWIFTFVLARDYRHACTSPVQVGVFLQQLVAWGRSSRENGWHTKPRCVGWAANHGVTPFDAPVATASAASDLSAQTDTGSRAVPACDVPCGADDQAAAQRMGRAGSGTGVTEASTMSLAAAARQSGSGCGCAAAAGVQEGHGSSAGEVQWSCTDEPMQLLGVQPPSSCEAGWAHGTGWLGRPRTDARTAGGRHR
jgi:hypothetical protein